MPSAEGRIKKSFRSEWTANLPKQPTHCRSHRLVEFVHKEGRRMLLLVMVGVCASLVDDIIEMSLLGLTWTRQEYTKAVLPGDSAFAEFAVWSSYTIAVATVSVAWTSFFDPMAAGSGIPEMKSIISYEHRKDASRYLRARTLVSKIGGLTLALGCGVSIGKEGPFVHTSSIIAHRLMKHLSWFRRIYDNDMMRRHIYDVASAVGVTTTFRAPIGGALFAIEATSTVFMVSNYWQAFVAAMSALLARQAVYMVRDDLVAVYRPQFLTNFADKSFEFAEIVAFALLAVITGLLGVLYASASTAFKKCWRMWAADKPVILAAWTLLLPLAAILCIPVGLCRLSFQEILHDLTSSEPTLPDRWHTNLSLSVFTVLLLAGFIRLIATALSTTLPIPTGDFLPTFIAGATFGRFFGEVLQITFPSAGIVPGGYALAGGAGLVASTTNTASVAVIALEFTGQFVYTIPLILSTLIASGVGCTFRMSVYDSVIAEKGYSHLPTLDLEDIKASDVMLRRFPLLTLDMAQTQLRRVLQFGPPPILPVVDNLDNMLFIGCVDCSVLEKIIYMAPEDAQLHSTLRVPQPVANAVPVTKLQQPTKEDEGRMSTLVIATKLSECALTTREDGAALLDSSDACTPEVQVTSRPLKETLSSDLIHERGLIDSAVLQVDPDASLQRVHLLFEMVKCSSIWVTRRGRLAGLLQRQHLHTRIAELKRKNSVVCPSLPT